MKRLLALLCLPLLLLACGGEPAPQVEPSPPFLWEVEGEGTRAWLLGTMHVSDPRVTTLHPLVEEVLAQAQALSTEIGESPSDGAKLAKAGMLPEGESLADILSPATYETLHGYLALRGMSDPRIDRMRPWMVALQLAQLDAIPLLQGGKPLDLVLRDRARDAGLALGQVETIDEQIAVLSWGDQATQVHLLEVTLDRLQAELTAGESSLQHLLALYLAGDDETMWDFALSQTDFDDPLQVGIWEELTTVRNRRMAARIHEQLQAEPGKARIYAFGTLHFLGAGSVVEDLRARGYRVSRVRPEPSADPAPSAEDAVSEEAR